MKNAVPANAKIAKDAKESVQECVSEFISFITSEAAEKCLLEKRKTIGGDDIIYAMTSLGFENYAAVLKLHLAKLRQASKISLLFLDLVLIVCDFSTRLHLEQGSWKAVQILRRVRPMMIQRRSERNGMVCVLITHKNSYGYHVYW
jgi:histone H3/H4